MVSISPDTHFSELVQDPNILKLPYEERLEYTKNYVHKKYIQDPNKLSLIMELSPENRQNLFSSYVKAIPITEQDVESGPGERIMAAHPELKGDMVTKASEIARLQGKKIPELTPSERFQVDKLAAQEVVREQIKLDPDGAAWDAFTGQFAKHISFGFWDPNLKYAAGDPYLDAIRDSKLAYGAGSILGFATNTVLLGFLGKGIAAGAGVLGKAATNPYLAKGLGVLSKPILATEAAFSIPFLFARGFADPQSFVPGSERLLPGEAKELKQKTFIQDAAIAAASPFVFVGASKLYGVAASKFKARRALDLPVTAGEEAIAPVMDASLSLDSVLDNHLYSTFDNVTSSNLPQLKIPILQQAGRRLSRGASITPIEDIQDVKTFMSWVSDNASVITDKLQEPQTMVDYISEFSSLVSKEVTQANLSIQAFKEFAKDHPDILDGKVTDLVQALRNEPEALKHLEGIIEYVKDIPTFTPVANQVDLTRVGSVNKLFQQLTEYQMHAPMDVLQKSLRAFRPKQIIHAMADDLGRVYTETDPEKVKWAMRLAKPGKNMSSIRFMQPTEVSQAARTQSWIRVEAAATKAKKASNGVLHEGGEAAEAVAESISIPQLGLNKPVMIIDDPQFFTGIEKMMNSKASWTSVETEHGLSIFINNKSFLKPKIVKGEVVDKVISKVELDDIKQFVQKEASDSYGEWKTPIKALAQTLQDGMDLWRGYQQPLDPELILQGFLKKTKALKDRTKGTMSNNQINQLVNISKLLNDKDPLAFQNLFDMINQNKGWVIKSERDTLAFDLFTRIEQVVRANDLHKGVGILEQVDRNITRLNKYFPGMGDSLKTATEFPTFKSTVTKAKK